MIKKVHKRLPALDDAPIFHDSERQDIQQISLLLKQAKSFRDAPSEVRKKQALQPLYRDRYE